MNEYNFKINPCPAPRMTQSDRWNKRPVVQRYFAFRDELKYLAYLNGCEGIPGTLDAIIFSIPMPKSWSNKKRAEMEGTAHTQTPDLDNLLKAFLDALCPQDSYIHCIGKLKKVWSKEGNIHLKICKNSNVTLH
ncbi:MAG TPA: RusA family crossover junction endodeoxyribonuclease [Bacteroides sp.]|nr:RusA family crossover junction endodeoxyribonuclease [Bacteroides sp.]